ncbi:hypothetical protein MUO14_24145 [Halobacillus shinanisalinarum]|uniref:Uncharacterized protein n=1 Tax=Halobacillus shinanisalinarum TaxID=2932258 RepID=A0ABY4H1A2_9BACI|nr:hypothetical protein [Halobacillus shinanisalinarum]UOQ93422.1 hypothetical protein MUO14_24145 [Halobacillus shinanisalinarum]
MYFDAMDVYVSVGSDGYAYGSIDYSFSGAENIFSVHGQVSGAYSSSAVCGFENITSTGFTCYVTGTGRTSAVDGRSFQVRMIIFFEPE